ncbi:MAG: DMT family transporter [Bacteroidota bacterium]
MTAKTRAEGILLGMTLIWGSTFAIGKIVLDEISPLGMIAVRFLLATLILLAVAYRSIFPLKANQVLKGVILGLFLFGGFVVQTIGLTITTASKSAFITGMMVVFVPLLQIVVERRAPKLGNLFGVIIVSVGLWFLTSPSGSSFNIGDALTLACALLFGVYIVYLDVVSHDMNAAQLTFLQVTTNALLAGAGMVAFEGVPHGLSLGAAGGLLYLTVCATLLTTFLQSRYQKDTTPTRAAIIFTIEPVFAAILAAMILDERLGWAGMGGGALIVLGVLVSELSDNIPILNRSFEFTES